MDGLFVGPSLCSDNFNSKEQDNEKERLRIHSGLPFFRGNGWPYQSRCAPNGCGYRREQCRSNDNCDRHWASCGYGDVGQCACHAIDAQWAASLDGLCSRWQRRGNGYGSGAGGIFQYCGGIHGKRGRHQSDYLHDQRQSGRWRHVDKRQHDGPIWQLPVAIDASVVWRMFGFARKNNRSFPKLRRPSHAADDRNRRQRWMLWRT